MRLWMKRRGDALRTYTAECREQFDTLPWEKALRVDITQPRNNEFNRLFHALCQRIASSIGEDHDNIVDWFKIETGHYILVAPGHHSLFETDDALAKKLRELAYDNVGPASDAMREAADRIDDLNYRLKNREKLHLKSIAFDKMDEIQFKAFFERCIVVMYERWKVDPKLVADLLEPKTWKRP